MKILELRKVRKFFGGIKAVESFSLDVEEGEIVGLIGPNGAGKSTLFNCVAGVFPPTTGEILFQGTKINNQKPWDLCRKGLARTFQIVKPFASRTVLYNVMVGAFADHGQTRRGRAARPGGAAPTSHGGEKRPPRRQPHHRRPQMPGDRQGPGHTAQAAAARRGHGRPAADRGRRDGGDHQAAARGRDDHLRDRAHHARHHGAVGPDRGPALRHQDRRRARRRRSPTTNG